MDFVFVGESLILNCASKNGSTVARGTCKAGAFRIHFFSMLIRARTGTTHGNCSGSYVTYFQRDEVERAGAPSNSRPILATILSKTYLTV